MQERHMDRARYFQELATTGEKYFLPYISGFKAVRPGMNVLEIGCGEGGILLPFSRLGCHTIGIDMDGEKIRNAVRFFEAEKAEGRFIASDIFKIKELEYNFDIIICHDVFEHIHDKVRFLRNLRRYVKKGGVVFMSFPAWLMPFGGHQQICRNRYVSHLPFIHLLPNFLYRAILRMGGESDSCIRDLMDIKETGLVLERFEKMARLEKADIVHRRLYFINPHYETKFGLRPRVLNPVVGSIPYFRNFFTTSCFYLIQY